MNLSQNTAKATDNIKSAAKSPLFIAALALLALAIVLSLVNMFTGSLARDLYAFSDLFGFDDDFHLAVSAGDAGQFNIKYFGFWQIIGTLLTAVPGIIMVYAVYKLYTDVKKENFALVRTMMTVNQIICCVSLVLIEIVLLMTLGNITAGSLSDAPDEVGGLFTFAAVAALAIYLTALFFCNSVKRSIDIASATVSDTPVTCDITLFAPIFIAIIGLITVIVPIFTGNIVFILSSLCSGASHIIFGYILYDFRKKMLLNATY